MIVVKLDDAKYGAGPATVIAHVDSVAEYHKTVPRDRDGCIDARMRLWQGDAPVGARVVTKQF